jgi:two-component system phosphate regulon sensor histidine kinase PhoR
MLIIISIIVLCIIGNKRKNEIIMLKQTIAAIRSNSYNSDDEIKLNDDLKELENEIKLMFNNNRTVIANMKKLEQFRTEFLGNVSHELRTPIFAIQGFIETLLDGALNDEKVNRTFLKKANQHTLNLNNLLNDLIDISMIESGQMKMSFRYFNINELLENIISEMKAHADKKELELRFESNKEKVLAYGDKDKIRQVMVNLILNAIKYTENGFVEVKYVIKKDIIIISVKDSGIGISDEDQKRIFERFYRVDKDRSREMGGTGLGLAIVKHIIEAHNSKIKIQSVLGEGSEFSFYLKKG